jgi:hypothetical protein
MRCCGVLSRGAKRLARKARGACKRVKILNEMVVT